MGIFVLHRRRKGKITSFRAKNQITTAGKLALVNACFINPTVAFTGPWYFGLIDIKNFVALSVADTMALHVGWQEHVAYESATRKLVVTWVGASSSGQNSVNAIMGGVDNYYRLTRAIGGLQGLFLVNNNVKDGITGTLFSTLSFDSRYWSSPNTYIDVLPGDEVFVEYLTSIVSDPVIETP